MRQEEIRHQPYGQAILNGANRHNARGIQQNEQHEEPNIVRAEYSNRRSEQNRQHTLYRQTFKNGTVYFEGIDQEPAFIDRQRDIIQPDYPDISTIVPQLVEQLRHLYPRHTRCACSLQGDVAESNDNHDLDLQSSEFEALRDRITPLVSRNNNGCVYRPSFFQHESRIQCITPVHPFVNTGDQRPPLYSVHQFDVSSSSVSLIEWPKVLVSPEALLNGPSTSGICDLYPKGFTIEVHKYPKRNYRLLQGENTVESGRTLADHQSLVRKFLPQGFLVRIPPNSIVLARGQTRDSPFSLLVHKPRNQNHRCHRLDSKKFGQNGVQQQYCCSLCSKPWSSEHSGFPEVFCCDIPKVTAAQIELTDKFSPFHLAQRMFPDGLLIKVAIKDLLHDKSLVIVKPNDVHVPLDFAGGRDGIASQESIENMDVLQGLSPVDLAKVFFPTGLVVNIDSNAVGELLTPIYDHSRYDVDFMYNSDS